MGKVKYDEEDRQRAINLYDKGLSLSEVERETGIGSNSVRLWCREEGIIRPRGGRHNLTDQEKQKVAHLYLEEGLSRHEIEEQTGIDKHMAYSHLKNRGLVKEENEQKEPDEETFSSYPEQLKKADKVSADEFKEIMDHAGLTWMRMATMLGLTYATLIYYREEDPEDMPMYWRDKLREYLLYNN